MIYRAMGLDALRYLAACMVIISHCLNEYQLYGFGGSFVDVFFVISGLVIAKITDKQFHIINFIKSRIWRIYPSYLIATLLMIIALSVTGHTIAFTDVIRSLILIPNFGTELYYPLLKVGWSLAYEMFFYTVFGVTLFCQKSIKPQVAIITFFVLSILLWDIYVFEFLCGLIIYEASTRKSFIALMSKQLLVWLTVISGFSAICVGEILNYSGAPFSTLLILVGSIMIVTGGYHSNYDLQLFARLGRNTSYEIYLYHPLVLNGLVMIFDYVQYTLQLPVFILVTISLTQLMVWARKKFLHLPGD